jgi:hypothetical protein
MTCSRASVQRWSLAGEIADDDDYAGSTPRRWDPVFVAVLERNGKSGRRGTMFDAPIALALFAAFLLGIVAGSGLEILVRGGRY